MSEWLRVGLCSAIVNEHRLVINR